MQMAAGLCYVVEFVYFWLLHNKGLFSLGSSVIERVFKRCRWLLCNMVCLIMLSDDAILRDLIDLLGVTQSHETWLIYWGMT